ncbi:MAG: PEP/pyruvate-binding domain-containing protein [Candidatus Saccharimonadales bacterium]
MHVMELKEAGNRKIFGGKAANLAKLIQARLPVPNGLAVGIDVFTNNGNLSDGAKRQIELLINPDKLYAVRSSALTEDGQDASWAGQFETFLDTKPQDVIDRVEECHNSVKNRAKSYATDKATINFDIAVVVQEMLQPEYAGVLFTTDPISGEHMLVTEYVAGLGEELVSGRADPEIVILGSKEAKKAPFDTNSLAELATLTEKLFGAPQDIEWAWVDAKIWLVQARPITVIQKSRSGYYLGEPSDLFYWGPSRAKPMYMSDFMTAVERLFLAMANDDTLPNPPKTLVLFDEGKMVWLSNEEEFTDFTQQTFTAYEKLARLSEDIAQWHDATEKLVNLAGTELTKTIVDAWMHTEFAEFALYGAETSLVERLNRFDTKTRQDIWGAFTVTDKPTFLTRIDSELASTKDAKTMAIRYSWIQDGYDGLSNSAYKYFEERLKVVGSDTITDQNLETKRSELIEKLKLSEQEVKSLNLARKLAEFMDERKAWMMQSRRLLKHSIGNVEHGWFFDNGKVTLVNHDDTHELWQRYVDFKASTNALIGTVASNGGKHFINGEVVVVNSPADIVDDGKIVVVPSTSPSYVPLMRKAKALVTDHGGLMSHAAIVAREFNLPCIVGTKQATKVLKNGDKVVLDLVKGEVNI